MLKITANDVTTHPPIVTSLRCPCCRQQATLEELKNVPDVFSRLSTGGGNWNTSTGQRRCPNPKCRAIIFVVLNVPTLSIIGSYPAERFDFDPSNIPPNILKIMEEAIACHSIGSFTATAMMVRKTLELLCENRGATGGNLHDRIKSLGAKLILPTELFQALDDLRLLGNDAAHVEAKTYDEIGKEEAEIALDLTKEILKAAFQYSTLLGRLKGLKKAP